MASLMDIIIRAKDEASAVMAQVGDAGGKAADTINVSWAAAGLAIAAAGVALEGLARSQQENTFGVEKLSLATGESAATLREWITEVMGAGDSVEEMTALMSLGTKQGLDGKAALQAYASYWDTVADATGESGVELAKASVALRALGIDAGQEGEAMSAFGYITTQTSGSISDFLAFVQKAGPQIRAMGLDVNDTAAILGYMENELGMTGKTAKAQFAAAVNSSDGDLQKMLATLGMSSAKLTEYRAKVQSSTGVIEAQSDAFNKTRTPLQGLATEVEKLGFKFGDIAGAAGQLAPILMAMGPIMWGLSFAHTALATAQGIAATATGVLSGAMAFLAANPIILVIAAIAALILGLIWLWNNCPPFRDAIIAIFSAIGSAIGGVIDGVVAVFKWLVDMASRILSPWLALLKLQINTAVAIFNALIGPVQTVAKSIGDAFGAAASILKGVWDGISSGVKGSINGVIGMVNSFIGFLNKIRITVPSVDIPLVGRVGGFSVGLPTIKAIPRLSAGAWNILDDMLAIIHRGEMVVPEGPASGLRAAFAGGGGFGGGGGFSGPLVYIENYSGGEAEDERLGRILQRRLVRR
jgi:hypothetical protein